MDWRMSMEYKTLNNGIKIPVLGFGTFQISGKQCVESVLQALKQGYRLIDTAEAYGNEKEIGEAIRLSNVSRKELFIVSKVNFTSYENTKEVVKQSLEHLQTDYLDLVLLHWPFGHYYQAWHDLEDLYNQGIIKAIGISNFDMDRMIDLIHFNHVVPAVNQIETHVLCQRQEEHQWLNKYQVAHFAYAPLGQGQLQDMFEIPIIQELALKYKKTPAQICLRYLTQNDQIVICKTIHEQRMIENISIFDFMLTEEEMNKVKAIDRKQIQIGKANQPEFVEFAMTW